MGRFFIIYFRNKITPCYPSGEFIARIKSHAILGTEPITKGSVMDYKTLLLIIGGAGFFLIPVLALSFRHWEKIRERRQNRWHAALGEIYARDAGETEAMLGTLNKSVDHEEEEFYRDVGQC